jgi:hypothetical protein
MSACFDSNSFDSRFLFMIKFIGGDTHDVAQYRFGLGFPKAKDFSYKREVEVRHGINTNDRISLIVKTPNKLYYINR